MPTVAIDINRAGFRDLNEAECAIIRLQEYLSWILKKLDSGNIVRITTNQTLVTSNDGNTVLDGTQLIMKDANGTTRAVLGLDQESGDFVFTLSNESGNTTLTLDSNGNAVFSGKVSGGSIESDTSIDVTTDLTVGKNVYLTSDDDSAVGTVKKIQMFEDAYDNRRVRIEAQRVSTNNGDVELKIVASKIILSTLDGIVNGAGERYAVERAGVSGSFTTVDGKTIVVQNGLVKSIT